MITNKGENEVYILGTEPSQKKKTGCLKILIPLLIILLVMIVGIVLYLTPAKEAPDYYFEPELTPQPVSVITTDTVETLENRAHIEVLEEIINDVPLKVYIPRHATMSLVLGMPDKADSTIVFAAMAADIRLDNQQIVGDFILSGERLARGVAKKGFVAIENNKITIGTGESTPLLQEVINNKGSFFRQYPLVSNGELIENKPKNKSVRRAIAVRNDQIIMVESVNRESFHDFSQALIDIGITDAVYLVGGNAYGWYRDKLNTRIEFGEELTEVPENISYIIWR